MKEPEYWRITAAAEKVIAKHEAEINAANELINAIGFSNFMKIEEIRLSSKSKIEKACEIARLIVEINRKKLSLCVYGWDKDIDNIEQFNPVKISYRPALSK